MSGQPGADERAIAAFEGALRAIMLMTASCAAQVSRVGCGSSRTAQMPEADTGVVLHPVALKNSLAAFAQTVPVLLEALLNGAVIAQLLATKTLRIPRTGLLLLRRAEMARAMESELPESRKAVARRIGRMSEPPLLPRQRFGPSDGSVRPALLITSK
jgi:hypothetical protein